MRGRWGCWGFGLLLAFAVVVTGPASAQTTAEADKLNAEMIRLYQAGRYGEAVPIAQRSLALYEKALGPDHPLVARALNNLAELFREQGRYAEAEPLYRRSLGIREKALGAEHRDVGLSLNNIAVLYHAQGRYAEAEPLYRRSLGIREKALGAEHPDVGQTLNNLAALYYAQGRYAEVEPLYRRSLGIREKALGPEHPDVGQSLNNLGGLYLAQGRYAEAVPLSMRNLAILEKALGAEHPNVGTALNNLAALYHALGRYAEAEPLHRRSVGIGEKSLGAEHPAVGISLNNLAEVYRVQGRYAEAEPLYVRAIGIHEKALGAEHLDVGQALNTLALLYHQQGRYAEAEPLYRRSLGIREKALGSDHPNVSVSLNNLAWLSLAQRDFAAAAEQWRRATAIVQRRAKRGLGEAAPGGSLKGEAQQNNFYFEGLVKTMHWLAAKGNLDAKALAIEMFETAQWVASSEAAASLTQMAARSAGGTPELAALVRDRQDLTAEWSAKDKLLIAARSELPTRRSAEAERSLRDRLAAIDARLAEIDLRLAKDFPDYAALASPKPLSAVDVQAALRDDELLVQFFDTDDRFKPLPEETFIWVVTKTEVRWLRSQLGRRALQREVSALRCGLDATAWHGEGAKRCAAHLNLSPDKAPREGETLPFDATRALALYKSLFGGADDLLGGKHLLIVPSGALTTLPFQVLVSRPPPMPDLSAASWLIRDNAITILPSVASLSALRRTGKPSLAARPMIGFANPLLDGEQKHPEYGNWHTQQAQRARAHTGCAATPNKRTAATRAVGRSASTPLQTAGLADLVHLRQQMPLPETADEVCEVARTIGADVRDMRIGARATETELKRLSETGELAKYRILHFATHGLLAGQLSGTREPGLILTPPTSSTPHDDGYLSGSEIAALKLDADWAILSACNTAGGAGQGEAAEALSGLARVFFYGGARALLVSHWEVDSDAAVKLVTAAIGEMTKDSGIGRGEALRRAMLTLMTDTSRPRDWVPAAHPSVWAPFVVVGEGGVGR